MGNSKLYVTCPYCGRRLFKAVPGSEVEQECPKCQNLDLVHVDEDGTVSAKIIGNKPA